MAGVDDPTVVADPTLPSFSWANPTGEGLSYEQLKQRRAVAAALASRARPYPTTIGQGLASVGESVSNAMYERQTQDYERQQRELDREAGVEARRAAAEEEARRAGRVPDRAPTGGSASLDTGATVASDAGPGRTAVTQQILANAGVLPPTAYSSAPEQAPSPNGAPGPAPIRMAALDTGTVSDAGPPGLTYGGGSPAGPGASMAQPPDTGAPQTVAATTPDSGAPALSPDADAGRAAVADTMVAEAGGKKPSYIGVVRPKPAAPETYQPPGGSTAAPDTYPERGQARVTPPTPPGAEPTRPLLQDTPEMVGIRSVMNSDRFRLMSDPERQRFREKYEMARQSRDKQHADDMSEYSRLHANWIKDTDKFNEDTRLFEKQRSEAAAASDVEVDRRRFGDVETKKAYTKAATDQADVARTRATEVLPDLYKAIDLIRSGRPLSGMFTEQTPNPVSGYFPNLPGRLDVSRFMTSIGAGGLKRPFGNVAGNTYREDVTATEEFNSLVTKLMTANLKAQFGGNPSNKEGELAAQQAGLTANLDAESKLRILMNMKEDLIRSIHQNNADLNRVFNNPRLDDATLRRNTVAIPYDPADIEKLQSGTVTPQRFEQRYGPNTAARHMPGGPRGR